MSSTTGEKLLLVGISASETYKGISSIFTFYEYLYEEKILKSGKKIWFVECIDETGNSRYGKEYFRFISESSDTVSITTSLPK